MNYFILELKTRNETLFYFGLICFVLAMLFLGLTRFSHVQVFRVLSYYLLRNTKLTFAAAVLYALLAVFTLVQALQGKPLFANRHQQKELHQN